MSIILKGIDMPKDRDCVNLSIYQNGDVYEQMDNGFYIIINAEAVQIPKNHGDIKDIDTVEDELDERCGQLSAEIVRNAPTILEAEE